MRYTFQKVSIKRIKKWVDSDGKKRQRTKEFWQTISPFNKNKNGTPKTREEILEELTAQANEWLNKEWK